MRYAYDNIRSVVDTRITHGRTHTAQKVADLDPSPPLMVSVFIITCIFSTHIGIFYHFRTSISMVFTKCVYSRIKNNAPPPKPETRFRYGKYSGVAD